MNKKMRELLAKIKEKNLQARKFQNEGKVAEAKLMKKSINSISTARAQLINKGIIYPVKYRELDFTVPQFSGFIHRLEEYKQWDTI